MNIKCFWIIGHNWSKWEIDRCYSSESFGSVLLIQKRECLVCGRAELRTVNS